MIEVKPFAHGSGSGSESDNWVRCWSVFSGGKELDDRRWKFFAVRRARQIARERGETEIKVWNFLQDKKKIVTV